MKGLKGEKVYLRPLEIEDLDAIYRWENDPENWQLGNTLTPFSRFFLEQFILNSQNNIFTDKQLRLMIETHEGELAGTIDLFDFDPHHKRAAVGILVDVAYRKRGYASEALDLLLDYCKNTLSLRQVYCTVNEDNPGSIKLFQNKNFEITGTRRQWNLVGKQWLDEIFMQCIFKD